MVRIPATTYIGEVQLRVHSLDVVSDFYKNVLGFYELVSQPGEVRLSASGAEPAQVILMEDRTAAPRQSSAPGLFHTAFLLPSRRSLAVTLERLIEKNARIHGFADHKVSEAIYLADPEGNGIELACDRPKETWASQESGIEMVTEPLDVAGLLRELGSHTPRAYKLDPGTTIGHIHLQISDLGKAERFYHHFLGFDVTQRSYPGALFLSAGDYHHHLGLNTWNSRKAAPAPGTSGLASFSINVPGRKILQALAARFEQNKYPIEQSEDERVVVHDPDGIVVHLVVSKNHSAAATVHSRSQEMAS
jgi:catechol 2,3-dioxygenase